MSFITVFTREYLPFLRSIANLSLHQGEESDHLIVIAETPHAPQPNTYMEIGKKEEQWYLWTTAYTPQYVFFKTKQEFREAVEKVISVVLARAVASTFREKGLDAVSMLNWVVLSDLPVLVVRYSRRLIKATLETEKAVIASVEIPARLKGKIPELIFRWVTLRKL